MVSFARARTRSWLSRLWPKTILQINNEITNLDDAKNLEDWQKQQNKSFLEASKNGGIWFS